MRPIERIEPKLPDVIAYEPLPCIAEYEEDGHTVHVYEPKPAHGYEFDRVCRPRRGGRVE